VAYLGLMQKLGLRVSYQGGRVESTIGNPAYLASYLVFHIWILALLLHNFWRKNWAKIVYTALIVFELVIIYFTATRGAVLGLLVSSFLFLLAAVLFRHPEEAKASRAVARRWLAAGLAVLVAVPMFLWLVRGSDFVHSNSILNRLTNYSFSEATITSRFKIWNIAWQGFRERPLLGWGQENFYLVFQKYFNPSLYNTEPWFDRSHNILLDWAVHAGLLGLLSYLALLGLAAREIWRAVRQNSTLLWSGFIILGALSSYFIQNLFIFDNLNTYLLFFAFLAYTVHISSNVGGHPPESDKSKHLPAANWSNTSAKFLAWEITLLVLAIPVVYTVNVKPIKEAKALIGALKTYQITRDINELLGAYRKALAHGTFGDVEVREQLGSMAGRLMSDSRFNAEEKKKFAAFAAEEMKKQLNRTGQNARDVKHLLFLGSLLNVTAILNPSYAAEAEQYLLEAIKLSPAKQPIYFELAQVYYNTGRADKAVELLRQAWDLERSSKQAAVNFWAAGVLTGRTDVVEEVRANLSYEKLGGDNLYRLAVAYQQTEDFEMVLKLYERLVETAPETARYRATYAALLAQQGFPEEAREQVEEAVRLDPSFKQEADAFVQTLNLP